MPEHSVMESAQVDTLFEAILKLENKEECREFFQDLCTVKELADKYNTDTLIMTGFLDGINESLKGYENPIETMDEDTQVKIEIDPEKLYYNMVEAKASWLYGLPQWDQILSEETRTELYKKQKASGTVRREGHKIYPNDPCPCGSGKKYKKCCGRNV